MNLLTSNYQLVWDWSRVNGFCADRQLYFAAFYLPDKARVEVHVWGCEKFPVLNSVYYPSPDLPLRVLEDLVEKIEV